MYYLKILINKGLAKRIIKIKKLKIIGNIIEYYKKGIYAIRINKIINNFIDGEK